MTHRRYVLITFPFILLVCIYFLGPVPPKPKYDLRMPVVPKDPAGLENYVREKDSGHKIKPDNEGRILWADSAKRKTEYAVVYIHGFSASQREGDPVHRRLAQEFQQNLYLPRLTDHGIDTTEQLLLFSADRWWESAKEALAVGNAIGERVILVSTSTGGTVALKLAAEYPDRVYALINLSPNIAINDPAAFLLNDPWGLHIARAVLGGNYRITDATEEHEKFWNKKYRIEALVELQELLESSMTKETFNKVKHPTLTLYYYKNEKEQDPQVKVSAMLDMHEQLGTPDSLKVIRAIPNAGAHVIGSSMTSGDVEGVYREMEQFMRKKLGISKAADQNRTQTASN